MRIDDALFGAVLIAAAAAILTVAWGLPEMPGQAFGPSLVPAIVGTGFLTCGSILIAGRLRRPGVGGLVELDESARLPGRWLDAALVLAVIVSSIVLWDDLGFLITSVIAMTLLIGRLRGRWLSSAVVAVAACVIVDLLFRRGLLVPLPLGPLTGILW